MASHVFFFHKNQSGLKSLRIELKYFDLKFDEHYVTEIEIFSSDSQSERYEKHIKMTHKYDNDNQLSI